ncbi:MULTISPECIES: hypothetical protein [unclassified Ruegeria]|uniref:hypothetical protein n=1 Tax=unclassified Ruegeria TaxID=2625375 RepID=UPI001491A4BA|nr:MULTISPECIES: hypothetical protein [unclassified Ruegeria]NOC43669.1 hypothetical protein [Ruegeria sp. HKCCD7559]NOD84255.1 hypothetical protein [Ruegeria sp. HKCCD6119]
MIKSAIGVEPCVPATMQSSNVAVHGARSNAENSSTNRFPPIENALTDIINNKRLDETNKDA